MYVRTRVVLLRKRNIITDAARPVSKRSFRLPLRPNHGPFHGRRGENEKKKLNFTLHGRKLMRFVKTVTMAIEALFSCKDILIFPSQVHYNNNKNRITTSDY